MSDDTEMHDLLIPNSRPGSLRQARPTWHIVADLRVKEIHHLLNEPRLKRGFKLLLRWLATALLISLFFVITKIYEAKENFPPGEKTTYNVLITALSILLALNFIVRSAISPNGI